VSASRRSIGATTSARPPPETTSREIEDLLDHAVHAKHAGVYAIDGSNECRLLAPQTQNFDPHSDRSQGLHQVMAKNGQEALLKLLDAALLRTDRALCRHESAEVLFSLLALGEIACDLREPDQRAVAGAERRDDDVGPEPRAIFADAPAFVFEPPVA
jgi:hypothetical protein